MFATIRRHQKWLWLVIIFGVIVPFVIYLDPSYSGRSGGGGRGMRGRAGTGEYGYLNGRAISHDEFMEAYGDARLQFFFYARSWPEDNQSSSQMFNADYQVRERLMMLEKLRALDVRVGDEAVADWIAQVFRERDRRTFNLAAYKQFVAGELRRGGLSEADFQRFVRHEVGIQQMLALGGLSGSLVTPREAEARYRLENEQITAEVALFSASNRLQEVIVAPDALAQFYAKQSADYRVPDQVRASYARFALTNFLAEADQQLASRTNLNAELDALYRQRGAEAFRDETGVLLAPEAARQKIRTQFRDELAMVAARKKATAFAQQLYEQYEKEPAQADNLERLASALGLPAAVTDPFTRFEAPRNLGVRDDFAEIAFALSTNQPMSTAPIVGEDAAYVIALKQRIPSTLPTLDEIRVRVTADFRRTEARRLAVEAGRKFYTALTNTLAHNGTFEAACREANVQPIKPPAFARSTRSLPDLANRVDLGDLKTAAADLAPGKVSEFEETRDGGIVVHVVSRQPVDPVRLKQELPEFTQQLREQQQREAAQEWVAKEKELAQFSDLPQLSKNRPKGR